MVVHQSLLASGLLETMGLDRADLHIQNVLAAVRTHLGMDVGFVSEFVGRERVFRNVDALQNVSRIAVGGSDPLEETYCQRVVDGRLPQLIQNAADLPEAAAMPVTALLPVGAHLSVPIRLPGGRIYGTFCCFRFTPDPTLNERDLQILLAFAAVLAELIHAELEKDCDHAIKTSRIVQLIATRDFHLEFQPIYRLNGDCIAAFEALARFHPLPSRGPDVWFGEAAAAGLGPDLEFIVAELAAQALGRLPEQIAISINLSPAAILTGQFQALLAQLPLHRMILEVTEHAAVASYAELVDALRMARKKGLRLAVDDAGAGHSSFRHVLALEPEIIKLDMSLTRNVDRDPGRQALATALTTFGHAIGSEIVAEGVENESELATLRAIGVTKVQGYFLGRPMVLDDAVAIAKLQPRSEHAIRFQHEAKRPEAANG